MRPRSYVSFVLNSFAPDARVLKACRTVAAAGYAPTVIGLHDDGFPSRDEVENISVHRVRLRTRVARGAWSLPFKYLECGVRMVTQAVRLRPSIVHANDLDTLPIAYLTATLTGARLVYDAHECWSDSTIALRWPGALRRLAMTVERALARRADRVITVSDGIAATLGERFGGDTPTVIRNLPGYRAPQLRTSSLRPLRKELGFSDDDFLLLYQGRVACDYGIDVLVDAMTHLPSDVFLAVLGDGPDLPWMRERALAAGLSHRVRFHPAVPYRELLSYTADATLGVHPIRGSCLNHLYCLPNKLFEYIQAGVPVLVSGMPEMSAVVERYQVGLIFQDGDAVNLAAKVAELVAAPERLRTFRANTLEAASNLCWEKEEPRWQQVLGELREEAR